MATASSVATELSELTTCSICLEVFNNPKSLPCLHAFCLKCIEGHCANKCPGDEALCPLCRKEFHIPREGLGGLQHHFFVQRLVDVRNASISEEPDKVPCEVCLEENAAGSDEIPTATMYCVDCDQKLCERCSGPHRRMKGGAHQVTALGAKLERELIQLRGTYCDKHKDKQVKLYCYQCNENICVLCFAAKHRQHETDEIQEVAKTFVSQMDSDNQQILSQVHNIRKMRKEKEKKRNEFRKQADKVKSEIKERGKQLHEMVDNLAAMQLHEVEMIETEDAKKDEAVEESYQLALVAMESFTTYSQELLDTGRPSDVTRAADELHKRATELLGVNGVTSVKYCPSHVTFEPADLTQVKGLDLIGSVTHTTENQQVGSLLHTVPDGDGVCGVTSLDNLLYVLRVRSSEQIEVYDTHSYRLQRRFTVQGLDTKSNMTACAHNVCLYISGGSDKCVHRVALPGVNVTRWPVNDRTNGISVTETHSVLVTCRAVQKIKEFTTRGQLLRQIALPQDIMSPWHTIQLSSGEFIVCHGGYTDPAHRVCLIGSDQHVGKSYGRPPGSGSQQMNRPVHLAVDKNGFVFVADHNNYRVLLLSPALTYVREVVSREQLKWKPMRLFLDVDRRRLYVAVNKWEDDKYTAGRVVVISV